MKKIIVRSADYELYRFFMPWKCLLSHDESRYIVRELEKQHPRFSPSFCYDAKYSLKEKRVLAEVVVMEKSSLARYKNDGGELFLEGNKKRQVFSRKSRFFQGISLLLIILTGLLSFRIVKNLLVEENGTEEALAENVQFSSSSEEEKTILPSAEKLMDNVLISVSKRGGNIASFSYSKNGEKKSAGSDEEGKCSFSIYGTGTEAIANGRYCVVSFKNNEPFFDLELPFGKCDSEEKTVFEGENSVDKKMTEIDENLEIASVRNNLRELGARIESENNGENKASFSFSCSQGVLYSALKICTEGAERCGWGEEKFSQFSFAASLYEIFPSLFL